MSLKAGSLTLKFNLMRLSVARLCGRVKPLPQDLVQQDGCGGAHVERVDPPAQRYRDEVVARRGDARAQAPPLGAEHEHDAAAPVDGAVSGACTGRGAVAPAAGGLGVGEE